MIEFNYKKTIFIKEVQFFECSLHQILTNTKKWLDHQISFTKIGKFKYLYLFYFKKFYFLLYRLCNKEDIFLNLNLFFKKPQICLMDTEYLIFNKYIIIRATNILYYKKNAFIKKKKVKCSPFHHFLSCIIPKTQNFISKKYHWIGKFDWKIFHFLLLLIIYPNFENFEFYKIYKKFSTLIYVNKFLCFFQNYIILSNGVFFWITMKNFRFFLFTGTVYLFQITIEKLKRQNFFNNIQTIKGSFNLFQYKKKFSKIIKLYIKSENYRFWKKKNIHSFFLCPVQKESYCKQFSILSCGHIFSFETITQLSDEVVTEIEFFLITKKLMNSRFIECPWCELVQEEYLPLNLILDQCFFSILDFHFLKFNQYDIDHINKYPLIFSEKLIPLKFENIDGINLVEGSIVHFFKDIKNYQFNITNDYYKYRKKKYQKLKTQTINNPY